MPVGARQPGVLVAGSIDLSLVTFRGRLIEALLAEGYRVVAAAPSIGERCRETLRRLGAVPVEYPLARAALDPVGDLATLRALAGIIREHRIDIVLPYTLKPVVYGSLAARRRGVRAVSLISGLGYAFASESFKARLIRTPLVRLLRLALGTNSAVIFQNEDDRALFVELGIVRRGTPLGLVGGSGVDLDEYRWREPRDGATLRFVLVARLMEEKGVMLYAEAARRLRMRWPDAEFHLVGESLPGSISSIDASRLAEYVADGSIVRHGWRDDLPALLAANDVFVLPTWYREGVPRSILEALAVGLAIVTTDTPGCRTTVREGCNGLLVPPRDLEALVTALGSLLDDPKRVRDMSRESRRLAVERFDVRKINATILGMLEADTSGTALPR